MSATEAQAVILAGGLGTRMFPRTERVPKYLLPVGGEPFASLQLKRLSHAGFTDALICVAHLGEQIREFVGDGSAFGLRVTYADEGETLLGTAGALRKAIDLLAPSFLVTYGDSLLPFDYMGPLRDLAAHPEALGTMAVWRNEGRFDRSNTVVEGEMVARYRKQKPGDTLDPELDCIDYGATALRREVIAALPEGAARGLDQVQEALAAAGKLRAHLAPRRFYEIGSAQGLSDLEAALARGDFDRGTES